MNVREKYTGNKEDFYSFLKDRVIKLFKEKLKIEENLISISSNEQLDYQIKFDSDENYGDFSIKVKWGEKPEDPEELEGLTENTLENLEDKPFEF